MLRGGSCPCGAFGCGAAPSPAALPEPNEEKPPTAQRDASETAMGGGGREGRGGEKYKIPTRGHPDLNQGPLDLQSNALPLSYTPGCRCAPRAAFLCGTGRGVGGATRGAAHGAKRVRVPARRVVQRGRAPAGCACA